jgi:DNA-binding NtrC family response regulator
MIREVYLVPGSSFSIGSCRIELKASGERGEIRLSDQEKFGRVIGRSVKMREIFYLLERMSLRDVTILLTGETGTGKEVFAQSIHDASARKDGPFLTVDCGSLPENLIESELFGHVKGAFTGATSDRAGVFEEASKGTVFLDEIGELPVAQQTKLLRVLESREIRRLGENASRPVDVRIIAATNRSLPDEVEAQRFRKDLYFRLSVCEIRIPALRERPDDVPLLAENFAAVLAPPGRAKPPTLSADALGALAAHPWPGNVRELRNVIEKAIALQDADEIDAASIALGTIRDSRPGAGGVIDASVPYEVAHDRFEREYLLDLLRRNDMNVTQAARSAGLHRQSIHRLLRKHGIKPSEYRE